jgi:hypothetical protein
MNLSLPELLYLRMRAQRLAPREALSVIPAAQVVREVCALQAQDASAAALSAWTRSAGLTAADVERARAQERLLVRAWCLRGTLHLICADELGWFLQLFGELYVARDARRRAELGLDEETCARGIRLLREILAGQEPLTRETLVAELAARGLELRGQMTAHLLFRAAMEGLTCVGPDRGNKSTTVLVDEWLGPVVRPPRDEALASLARRYLAAYAPAASEDLASWSGLPAVDVRRAWQALSEELLEVEYNGVRLWMLKTNAGWLDEAGAALVPVRLLPAFDTYLLGYRSRDLAIDPRDFRRVNAGGGIIHAVALVNGVAAAAWRINRRRGGLEVAVEPFAELDSAALPGLEAEVADLGRFLGVGEKASLAVLPPREK